MDKPFSKDGNTFWGKPELKEKKEEEPKKEAEKPAVPQKKEEEKPTTPEKKEETKPAEPEKKEEKKPAVPETAAEKKEEKQEKDRANNLFDLFSKHDALQELFEEPQADMEMVFGQTEDKPSDDIEALFQD